MQNKGQKLIHELAKECTSVEEVHVKLRDIFKDTLQQVFEAEIDAHLGYSKNDNAGDNTGNSRNGYYPKTVKSRFGEAEVRVPRDRIDVRLGIRTFSGHFGIAATAYSKLFARLSRTQLLPGVALAYFFSWAAVSASDP
ncbi:MAG: hypothetical protein DDT21_01832 [Syntrophomonadaceae bacterium]|nr:hypothetical protein [Bacillota bacterium]